jgi:hypothetical protein
MKGSLVIAAAAAAGLIAGAASAVLVPYGFGYVRTTELGPWRTADIIGVTEADPYTRAWVARHGIWALPRSEAMYLSANVDSEGRRLDAACTYLIIGADLPARWWSLTAYRDDFWMDNAIDRYSVTALSAPHESGQWRVRFSPEENGAGEGWLPSDGRPGSINLSLRLYDPDPEIVDDSTVISAPTIERESCQ